MSRKASVGIGIVGYGRRTAGLLRLLLKEEPEVELVAVLEPSAMNLELFKKEVAPNAAVDRDVRDLVRRPEVDWVMITTPNFCHAEQAIAAFQAGKHVFCEKPLATTIDDCIAMREAHRQSQSHFIIGFTLRYSPHYRKVKELVEAGAVGDIISFEFNETIPFYHGGHVHSGWRRHARRSGGHMLEKCCHDVDIADWLVRSKAARVASFGGQDFYLPKNVHHIERIGKNDKGQDAYCNWWLPGEERVNPFTGDSDVVDNQVAIVEFENGVRACFHANSNAGIPERRLYLCGTEGAIRADVLRGQIEVARIGNDEKVREETAGVSGIHGGGDSVLIHELLACMFGGATPDAGLEDGFTSAITALAIDQARTTGTVVTMAPIWEQCGLG